MKTESFHVKHDDTCPLRDLPDGLCECMKLKLIELFEVLDRLADENVRLAGKVEKKKMKKELDSKSDIC